LPNFYIHFAATAETFSTITSIDDDDDDNNHHYFIKILAIFLNTF
jgi:hypothetical protein